MHGTSFIMGNLKVRELKKYSGFLGKFRTFINKKILPNKIKKYNIKYLYADFKKGDGITLNDRMNKELNLYHQNYCGCIYSNRV